MKNRFRSTEHRTLRAARRVMVRPVEPTGARLTGPADVIDAIATATGNGDEPDYSDEDTGPGLGVLLTAVRVG